MVINSAISSLTYSSYPTSSNDSSPAVPPFVQYDNLAHETGGNSWDNSELNR